MHTETIHYEHNNQNFEGFLAFDTSFAGKRPAVLIAHAWGGRDDFFLEKAQILTKLGYVGFAMDVYGDAKLGHSKEENSALMMPLMENRRELRARLEAAFSRIKNIEQVDEKNIAAMGYCFGGLCVLDMARMGLDLKGALSFHGLLAAPENIPNQKIKAKVLALHGYDDPMNTPPQVEAFEKEMTEAKADWQMHIFGNTMHAFTNPLANDPGFGTVYNAEADARSSVLMKEFFKEIFTE